MATYTTLAEARAGYLSNADYADGAGSASKAAAFRSACRSLLVLLPTDSKAGSVEAGFDVKLVREELQQVNAYISTVLDSNGNAGARGFDLSELR